MYHVVHQVSGAVEPQNLQSLCDDVDYRYNLLFLAANAGVTTGETGGSVVDLTRMGLSASINGQEL